MSIEINNTLLRSAISRHLGTMPEPGVLHLFGLRGAVPIGGNHVSFRPNKPNEANDTIGFFGTELGLFLGSVDPGSTYTVTPLHPQGCAHLVNGIYRYTPGPHRGKPALRQAGKIRIWRDKDKDHVHDVSEQVHDPGQIAINIHAMGNTIQVGSGSAGCQVIKGGWTGKPWITFRDTVYKYYKPGQIVLYHLLDAADLIK